MLDLLGSIYLTYLIICLRQLDFLTPYSSWKLCCAMDMGPYTVFSLLDQCEICNLRQREAHATPSLWYGQYLMHVHSHIAWAVAAMTHQHGITVQPESCVQVPFTAGWVQSTPLSTRSTLSIW